MFYPRKATIKLLYDDTDISEDISRYVESFTYTDAGSNVSDSISLKLDASPRWSLTEPEVQGGQKWINGWMPDKEAVFHPTICTENWDEQGDAAEMDCGTLVVDDISYSSFPSILNVGAVSRPNGTSFHERNREQVWKDTSIQHIAQTIAERNGLSLQMDADDVEISIKEQDDNDSAFLNALCSTYGLIMKVYMGKIWIFDREKYKQQEAAATITEKDIKPGSLNWKTTLAGTYTGGVFTYTNQKEKVNIKVTIGEGDRMLKLNQFASSEADAQRQLQAAIDNANHSTTTASWSMMGRMICATQCVNLSGFGKMDGKYYLDSVTHTLDKNGGYVTKVSGSRVGG